MAIASGRVPCRYLGLQDVPRTADHAPSRTYYTWRASVDATMARLKSDLYRTAGNVHARLKHEKEKQRELVALVDLPTTAQAVLVRRREEIEQFRTVIERLEAALMELDAQMLEFS